jgi:2-oxoisovalerate dehydrogenase E2 component (dihydrolipoyl transacylase)
VNQDFHLPDLGEGLPEAELVQWLVAPGDVVSLNQTIAEVETAKAVVELPSPYVGTVRELHAAPGDVVPVGSVLISYDVQAGATATDAEPAAAPAEAAEKATPNLVGYGAAPARSDRPRRRARVVAQDGGSRVAIENAVLEAAPHDAIDQGDALPAPVERPRSTPPVRKLAKDLGIDLALVEASGASGLITRADVEALAARAGVLAAPAPVEPVATHDRPNEVASDTSTHAVTRIPIRGVRKFTAQAMVRSAFTAPHVTTFHTVDVTETMSLIAALAGDRQLEGHRIGILAVAAKAVCLALRHNPAMNARWDEAASEILQFGYVNLGIAAATDRGLVVPNIPDADRLNLVELADAIAALAALARSGRTPPTDMMGGTFSITNIGVFGVEAGTPILNPGEAGILALGAVQRRPWELHGEIALRDVLTLSLSFDHRLVDGAEGARFLLDVAGILQQPGRAMLLG